MPDMLGSELLRNLRQNQETEKLPFLLITACWDDKTILNEMKKPYTGFLPKPYKPEELEKAIKALFKK